MTLMKNLSGTISGYKPPEGKSFAKSEPLCEDERRKLSDTEVKQTFMDISRRKGESLGLRFLLARDQLKAVFGADIGITETQFKGLKVAAKLEFHTVHRTIDESLDALVTRAGFRLHLMTRPVLDGDFNDRFETVERSIPEIYGYNMVEKRPNGKNGGGQKEAQTELAPIYYLKFVEVTEPRTIRTYSITAREYASEDLARAAESAESLLELARMLRPPITEDMPNTSTDSGLPANVVDISSVRSSKLPQKPDAEASPSVAEVKAS